MKKIFLGILLLVMLAAGCATKAVEVLPRPALDIQKGLDCADYEAMLTRAQNDEARYTSKQNSKARGDFHIVLWGLLLYPPVALIAFRGDFEDELAEAKGRVEALERLIKTCGSDAAPAAPAAPDANTAG